MSRSFEQQREIDDALRNAIGHCPGCKHAYSSHGEYGCHVKVGSASCDDAYCDCRVTAPSIVLLLNEERRVEAFKKPCPDHKRYRALRKPTGNCEACWRLYIKVHPEP